MGLRESLQQAMGTDGSMLGKAYRAYILDPRLDGDRDREAFDEAVLDHVIFPFKDLIEALVDRMTEQADRIQVDLDDLIGNN